MPHCNVHSLWIHLSLCSLELVKMLEIERCPSISRHSLEKMAVHQQLQWCLGHQRDHTVSTQGHQEKASLKWSSLSRKVGMC